MHLLRVKVFVSSCVPLTKLTQQI